MTNKIFHPVFLSFVKIAVLISYFPAKQLVNCSHSILFGPMVCSWVLIINITHYTGFTVTFT